MDKHVKIKLFRSVFQGRDGFHARRWESADGTRSGYTPVPATLNDQTVFDHLVGNQVLGLYPLREDNTTWFLAMDFDGDGSQAEVTGVEKVCQSLDVPAYRERSRSGDGAHLWIFFESPLPAAEARELGRVLLNLTGCEFVGFDRFFPSQDRHTGKGLGNLIALPFQGQAQKLGNTLFINPTSDEPYSDQWSVLLGIRRLSSTVLERVLKEGGSVSLAPLPITRGPGIIAQGVRDPDARRAEIALGSHLEILYQTCPMEVETFLKDRLIFENPDWHAKQRRGHWLGDTPRFLRCCGRSGDQYIAPRGVWEQLRRFLDQRQLAYTLDDRRVVPEAQTFQSLIVLRPSQLESLVRILEHEHCVLDAPTGSGKTLLALEVIARRNLPTLILVDRKTLLEQWLAKIAEFLGLEPREIGVIGDGKNRIGERVTVAMMQSLARRDVGELVDRIGHVVVDECHKVPAKTFAAVVRQFPARYLLGLTATPSRVDGLGRLIAFYLGDLVKGPTATELHRRSEIVLPSLRVRATGATVSDAPAVQAMVSDLILDKARNQLIADDVAGAVAEGHRCLVLSRRREHCDHLSELLIGRVGVATLHGPVGKKQRRVVFEAVIEGQAQVLVSTTSLLGEGWDCPEISALFLPTPMGANPLLKQVLGRVTRIAEGKPPPVVFDYRDPEVEAFERMWLRRLTIYRSYLGNARLPQELQARSGRGRATVAPLPSPSRRAPEGQMQLDFGD